MRPFARRFALVVELTKRSFFGRYKGTLGGILWSFAQPLFLLTVYVLAFGFILGVGLKGQKSTGDFALQVFAGLIIFNAFSECLTQGPQLVSRTPNYVKKIVFPLEILPVVSAFSALAHAAIATTIWIGGFVVLHGMPSVTIVTFPIVMVAMLPLLLGVGWLLAALGVFARDLTPLALMVSHALLFLTPVFYEADVAPPPIQSALALNPLSFLISQFRDVLHGRNPPDLVGLITYVLITGAFAAAALALFRRLRHHFADAL